MKSSSDRTLLQESILSVVQYFDFFDYPVSFDQIYTFLPMCASEAELTVCLEGMVKERVLMTDGVYEDNDKLKYAVRGHGISFKNNEKRAKITEQKLHSVKSMISVLKLFPQIQLIGLSGSCGMDNADKDDDIDIFIIASQGRLWTARAICLAVSTLYGKRRVFNESQPQDKICFNLFFEEGYLDIPYFKQNIYIAHEVVQMRPLHVRIRVGVYGKFMGANLWIKKFFPNASIPVSGENADKKAFSQLNILGNILEFLLRNIQKLVISKHQTTEHLTAHQLWFFPEDFERKLESQI